MEEKRFNRLLERYKYSHEAVKELYEYYYPIIVRYINRQFRGEVDGQDVAQQFFLKLFQMKSYKIRTPNAWVRTVTRNIAIDILRKNGKQYRVKELLVLPDYTGPPDNVADILKVLSESEQQIMYLNQKKQQRNKKYGRNGKKIAIVLTIINVLLFVFGVFAWTETSRNREMIDRISKEGNYIYREQDGKVYLDISRGKEVKLKFGETSVAIEESYEHGDKQSSNF